MPTSKGLQALASGAAFLWAIVVPAWSGDLPPIPSPKGFVEASSLVPALKNQALLGHPSRTKVIGVYLLPDELAKIMHGAPEHMTIFCRAYVNDEFGSQDEAKARFRQMVISEKKDESKKFDLTDPEVSRIIQRYVDATKEHQGQTVEMIGATFLGSILDTADIYGMSVIASATAQTDQGQVLIPLTGTVAWIRWGSQILELSDIAQFEGSESITTARDVLLEWLKALPPTNAAKLMTPTQITEAQRLDLKPSLAEPPQRPPFEEAAAAFGRGDYATALRLFRQLAEQGDARAQNNLGLIYLNGEGAPQDYAEAAKWLRLAANQGNANAQTSLGAMYVAGQGVPQNYSEAVKWYRLGADQGLPAAQINVGAMYFNGRGVPKDYAEAAKWYSKAADGGSAEAQLALGAFYADGVGVPQDYVKAYLWFNLAASKLTVPQGGQVAAEGRDSVAQHMTLEQIAKAQKLADEWAPLNH